MATANVEFEKQVSADMRRSYKNHREHYLNGDLSKKWKPRVNYHLFESFDELIKDASGMLKKIMLSAAEESSLDGIVIDLTIKRGSNISYCTIASYDICESEKGHAVLSMNISTFERLYKPDLSNLRIRDIKSSIYHELRHHKDIDFLVHCNKFLERAKERFPSPHEYQFRNSYLYLIEYLTGLRGEGFADFEREPKFPPLFFSKYKRALREKDSKTAERYFFEALKKHTNTVTKVFDFLQDKPYILFFELINNVEKKDSSPLELETSFDKYYQGKMMFFVLALAELKDNGFDSLFKFEKLPSDVYEAVEKKVLGLSNLSEFFEYYYASARKLGLKEEHMIIPEKHVKGYLALEAKLT